MKEEKESWHEVDPSLNGYFTLKNVNSCKNACPFFDKCFAVDKDGIGIALRDTYPGYEKEVAKVEAMTGRDVIFKCPIHLGLKKSGDEGRGVAE